MNKPINEERIMQRRAVKLHFDNEDDAHCQVNNVTLMQEVVYDWLGEIFGA